MKLFSQNIKRVNRYAFYSESHYDYLNISNRPEYIAVRNKIEEWFSSYPQKIKSEFRKRFRTNNDNQFMGAFFELVLHQLFIRLNTKLQIHPKLMNSSKRPDFLIEDEQGNDFYLECVVSSGISEEESSKKTILNQIFDSVNKLQTDNFFIGVEVRNLPDKPIPSRKIREFLQRRLKNIDPYYCEQMMNKGEFDSLPKWEFKYDDFILVFKAIPKSTEFRGKITEKPIGMANYGFHWKSDKNHILKSLKDKANKYKNLDKPFVIAVNSIGEFNTENDILDALFGPEMFISNSLNESENLIRVPSGLWIGKNGKKNTRVSGVLFIKDLYPSTVGVYNFTFYINPWANFEYVGKLREFPTTIIEDSKIRKIKGKNLYEFLNLENKWPHGVVN